MVKVEKHQKLRRRIRRLFRFLRYSLLRSVRSRRNIAWPPLYHRSWQRAPRACSTLHEMHEIVHSVEWYDDGDGHTANFENPREAYQFWLSLRRGIRAKLYQHGVLAGEGTGEESGD